MILARKQVAPALLLTSALFASDGHAAGPPQTTSASELQLPLERMHEGRFSEAERETKRLLDRSPGDPAAAFLHAFVAWWQLLYDDRSPQVAKVLEQRLAHAADVARAAGTGRSAGLDHRVWLGYARILQAQVHASRREILAAAKTAKEGRRLLMDALRDEPGSPEPLFGLGTYNYYADQMSALAKGLRFLLGLAGGDRQLGLDQLRAAADKSHLAALESRLLLATIYAGRRERDYRSAQAEIGRALEQSGDALVALDAAARLDLALGRIDRALRQLEQASRRAQADPPADPAVLAGLTLQHARAEFARFRPDRSRERLRELIDPAKPVPERVRAEALALDEASARLVAAAQPPSSGSSAHERSALPSHVWQQAHTILEQERQAGVTATVAAWEALQQSAPRHSVFTLFLGRALLAAGRPREALPLLDRAARAPDLPVPWAGPAKLLAGQAADLAGDRRRAIELYREAIKAPPFIQNAAPHNYMKVPFESPSVAVQNAR